jgi:hypothetical protein
MPTTLEQLKAAAAELSTADRSESVCFLLESLDSEVPSGKEMTRKEFETELRRRTHEIETGQVRGVTIEELFQQLDRKRNEQH